MAGSRKGGGRLVVGIDGGATRTRYLVADASSGAEIGRAEGRGSLLGAGEDETVIATLAAEVRSLVEAAGGELPIDVLCAGLAGAAGRSHAALEARRRLLDLEVARRVDIVPDAEVAFADAFGAGGGILLIGGTGSIGMARAGDPPGAPGPKRSSASPRVLVRVGGWGALLGDEGSGYGIGLEGLRAAIRGREGRGTATSLTDGLFAALSVGPVAELLEWTRDAAKARIAALAPLVIEEADAGDAVAAAIVGDAVRALTAHATALRRSAGEGVGSVVALVGGLVEPGGPLHARVAAALRAEGLTALGRVVDGARGAVRLARD